MVMSYALSAAIIEAGGTPVLLPHEVARVDDYLKLCDGVVLAGGDDPDTTPFGQAVHDKAEPVTPQRQAFELAVLAALDGSDHPVLGVCLGMQYMALHHGGRLHQHLGDVLDEAQAALHAHGEHAVESLDESLLDSGVVFSHHHQAVADAGSMRVVAVADEVIEAIALPHTDRFYLGVQWHPERGGDAAMGRRLFGRLVSACG